MNNASTKMKITIIGPYPPPVGGNSIHVMRLKSAIDERCLVCNIIDLYADSKSSAIPGVLRYPGNKILGFLKALLVLFKDDSDVVHIHVSAMKKFVLAGLPLLFASFRSRHVLTIHSGSFNRFFDNYNMVLRWFVARLIRRFDHIITVNAEQKTLLLSLGVSADRVTLIPAFLPPSLSADVQLDALIECSRKNKQCLLITSGSGLPLYGYEVILKALHQAEFSQDVSLYICIYNTCDDVYMSQVEELIETYRLDVTLLRDLTAEKFNYLLSQCDIYIRSTDRDGDAVAIREANYYGLQVIASDVVVRADFCRLFNREAPASLICEIEAAMSIKSTADIYDSKVDSVDAILSTYYVKPNDKSS